MSVLLWLKKKQLVFRLQTSFNKFKKIWIIPSIFSEHNGMKLKVNSDKKTKKSWIDWK